MKNLTLFLLVSCAAFYSEAEAIKYKVKEYTDQGPIRITFRHQGKYSKTTHKYELVSLDAESIEKLLPIRRHPEVCKTYADHSIPSEDSLRSTFMTRLLPRVEQKDSLFPFVLKRMTKTHNETPTKTYEILGFFNVGVGFKPEDRQYGYYIFPGRQLNEHEANAQGRPQGRIHFENWGEGLASTTATIQAHFVMQFHEQAPGKLILYPKKGVEQTVDIQRTRFSGVLSGTCDPDNIASRRTMENSGLRKRSIKDIEARGIDACCAVFSWKTAK